MTLEDKRAAAISWLRSRGKYILDKKHSRLRQEQVEKALQDPPQKAKVRIIHGR